MAATRVVEYHDNFSFDVQRERGRRDRTPDGTPLLPPVEEDLVVVVFYDRDHDGTVHERRYRMLPETYATMQQLMNGGGATVQTASALEMPAGVGT